MTPDDHLEKIPGWIPFAHIECTLTHLSNVPQKLKQTSKNGAKAQITPAQNALQHKLWGWMPVVISGCIQIGDQMFANSKKGSIERVFEKKKHMLFTPLR